MYLEIPQEVLSAFEPAYPNAHPTISFDVTAFGNGLINQSFKVTYPEGKSIFVQQINTSVFKTPNYIQENYFHLWQHLQNKSIHFLMPLPVYPKNKALLYVDQTGKCWRAFEFIPDTCSLSIASNSSQVYMAAKTFARFTASFHQFDAALLKETIPNFHNLAYRYTEFEQALKNASGTRKEKASELIKELQQRIAYKSFYIFITGSNDFPKRVMHHDAKIANVLSAVHNGEVICPVDFDTTMPGYFFSDLGDMIRSMTCSHDEASTAFDKMQIIKDYYKAIIDGYTEAMNHLLTDAEKKHIHCAGLMMIYMQALRFLTDYLNGDIYYKISYTEQNFDRAFNQFTLLKKLETFLEEEFNFKMQSL